MRTRSIEEVRETLARIYAKPILTPTHGTRVLDATMNYYPLNDLGLYYRRYGAGVRLEFPESGYMLQIVPLHGSGELTIGETAIALAPGMTVAVPANTSWVQQCSPDYEHLAIRIEADALTAKLVSMTGASINEPLRMTLCERSDSAMAMLLLQYINSLVDTVSSVNPIASLPHWWIAQTEQLLMALLICCNQHNYSHLLGSPESEATPLEVRRAEGYIEANWHRPITLQELAAVAGVSEFSLMQSFKQHRDYSPLEFLARIRLQRGGSEL